MPFPDAFSDYRKIPELDQYERNDLAEEDEEIEGMDQETRLAAEREMDERDRGLRGRRFKNAMEEEGTPFCRRILTP